MTTAQQKELEQLAASIGYGMTVERLVEHFIDLGLNKTRAITKEKRKRSPAARAKMREAWAKRKAEKATETQAKRDAIPEPGAVAPPSSW